MKRTPKIKIFLTFDHELPLGGVRTTWDDVLFQPTQTLFDVADELGVKITLFTDVLCAIKFKEWDHAGYYLPYVEQIKSAVTKGHDVQLHLHPHWLTSTFSGNKFSPSDDYSLTDFVVEKNGYDINRIIKDGVDFLNDTLKPSFLNYSCNAFRAGGYNLGDELSRSVILTALYKHGIRYDSSIAKGYYFNSKISEVDYRHVPSKCNWFLSLDGQLNKESNNTILEIPIASIPKSPFEIPTFLKMKKFAHRAPLSRGYQIHDGKPGNLNNKIKVFMSSRMLGFDNYTYQFDYLLKILDHNIRKYHNQDIVMLSAVGHPKTMGDYAWDMMRHFVINARKKYPEIEFSTFTNLSRPNVTG